MVPGVAAPKDFIRSAFGMRVWVESDSQKFRLSIDFESYSFGTDSEFLANTITTKLMITI